MKGSTANLDRAKIAKTVNAFLSKRRPSSLEVRAKLDLGFRFYNQSVELFEIRPKWRGTGKTQNSFAKATFVKSQGLWKVYWMRGNGEWYPYEPAVVRSLNAFLKLVDEDKQHCFFG